MGKHVLGVLSNCVITTPAFCSAVLVHLSPKWNGRIRIAGPALRQRVRASFLMQIIHPQMLSTAHLLVQLGQIHASKGMEFAAYSRCMIHSGCWRCGIRTQGLSIAAAPPSSQFAPCMPRHDEPHIRCAQTNYRYHVPQGSRCTQLQWALEDTELTSICPYARSCTISTLSRRYKGACWCLYGQRQTQHRLPSQTTCQPASSTILGTACGRCQLIQSQPRMKRTSAGAVRDIA